MITRHKISVTTTGLAGAAVGDAQTDRALEGFLYAVQIDYHASAPATTDLVISEPTAGITILTRANTSTDGMFYPRVEVCGPTGAGATLYDLVPIMDFVKVAIAESNALTGCAVVTLWVLE